MKFELVQQLADVLARTSVCEIEYSEQGDRFHLTRFSQQEASIGKPAAIHQSRLSRVDDVQPHTIVASIGGVFYRSPSPGEPPFVLEGDSLQEGQTVGVVEAMKTLIAIEADQPGVVQRILIEDGTTVTAGTAIFEVKPGVSA